ncbi:MAG: hypothetical protein D6795_09225, partial [Deltaproteobacteria bacterium]
DVPEGELLALLGSFDLVEISVNNGSAAQHLIAGVGDPVVVEVA